MKNIKFKSSRLLKTPVLFLVFNRPDTTSKVFEKIRQAKPQRLYVASDGPRIGNDVDKEKVIMTRDIATKVDWPCEIKTLFREKNLGCKKACSTAINWFFEYEEMGIILEDDTLPHLDFFTFCENLLVRYANDEKITAIIGPTGSGKSTLLDLLLGLRQPTKGEILIQTTKVSDITRESIAKNISFSPQETQIFSGSLAAHVYYGNESRTLSEVTEALKYSEALEFFGGASSKSAITLERDAFLLSGGQKKRLDLARCILKDPQLLLLDEPTGNLDARTEHGFGKTLKKMCKDQNKTIILIGHQMSLVQIADNIIILKDGSIECQGSNKYVSTRSAWYREAIKGSRINPKKLP